MYRNYRVAILAFLLAACLIGYNQLAEVFLQKEASSVMPLTSYGINLLFVGFSILSAIIFLFRYKIVWSWFAYTLFMALLIYNVVICFKIIVLSPSEIRPIALLILAIIFNFLLVKSILTEIKNSLKEASSDRKRKVWNWAKHQKRWFGKWHLYLGIMAGAILCITGLTGSILVFQDEIDQALNPSFFEALKGERRYTIEEIIPLVREKYPNQKFGYVFANDPDNLNSTYRFLSNAEAGEFFVDPFTGEIVGKRLYNSSFIRVVTSIHRTLLIPTAGRYIVGLATLSLLILTISGLRLWVPQQYKKGKQWKAVLTVNFKAGFKRQNYDWHNVLGFYSVPVVIMLAITGFGITFSTVFIAFMFMLTGQSPQSVAGIFGQKSSYTTGAVELSVGEVASIARKKFPDAELHAILVPTTPQAVYRLELRSEGDAKTGNRIMTMVDQYSGKVVLNSETDFPNIGNSYLSWLIPIHYGTFGGMPTRILAFLGGLMPLLLYITGFIIWWPRHKKRSGESSNRRVRKSKEELKLDEIRQLPFWKYNLHYLVKGFKFGMMLLVGAFLSGALYGLISGVVIQPALFAVLYIGISVIVNFVVALATVILTLITVAPFGKGKSVGKYASYSLAFFVIFFPICLAIGLLCKDIF